jgi:hypothetical protein
MNYGPEPQAVRNTSARDAAAIRLRRVTRASIAVAVGLAGTFAALAAGSTQQTKKSPLPSAAATAAVPAPLAVAAPAPPLVPAQSSEPAAQPQSPPPAAAPASATTPPVVVSGGS